jgi:hypothetical protein
MGLPYSKKPSIWPGVNSTRTRADELERFLRPVDPEGNLTLEYQEELVFGGMRVQRRPAARRLRGDEGKVSTPSVDSLRNNLVHATSRTKALCTQVGQCRALCCVHRRVLSGTPSPPREV